MKTTQEIFLSITKCTDSLFTFAKAMELADKTAKAYAYEVARDTRSRCASNANLIYDADTEQNEVDFDAITCTEIILP